MKTCDMCDSQTLADDGDDFGEWSTVRCSDPDCKGCMIECVVCAGKRWDEDKYFQRAMPRPTPDSRICPTCMNADGTPNVAWAKAHGLCTLCGQTTIPWGEPGAGFCSRCKDHSANRAECDTCGTVWEDWAEGTWYAEPAA